MIRPTLLDQILAPEGLSVVFQPICRPRANGLWLDALEALVRGPAGTNAEPAEVLFEYVRRKREEPLVDRVCVARALQEAAVFPTAPRLALNVHASTLGRDPLFVGFLVDAAAQSGIACASLTVEIVEHAPSWGGPSFLRALDALRATGIRVALDDVGLGQSNYRMILDCRPDYFKIDRYLVRGAANDLYRRRVLASVADLARAFGAAAIAEGVERRADLAAAMAAGIDLSQGYLFSRPLPAATLLDSVWLQGRPVASAACARIAKRWRRGHDQQKDSPGRRFQDRAVARADGVGR